MVPHVSRARRSGRRRVIAWSVFLRALPSHLADDVIRATPVPARRDHRPDAKRGSGPSLFELNVTAHAVRVDHFAEQDGAQPSPKKLRHEMSELVTGISHRDRVRPIGDTLAGEDFGSFRAGEPVRIETKVDSWRPVPVDQPREATPASAPPPARKSRPAAPHRYFERGNGPS